MRSAKCVIVGLLLLSFLIASSPYASAFLPVPANLNSGPLIDSILLTVIENQDQKLWAMNAGVIEMDTTFYQDPSEIPEENPSVQEFRVLRNGYGCFAINCSTAPLNESVLRRAFAFAFDKARVIEELFDGLPQVHDSIVPSASSWCIEDELQWHYYTSQSAYGNLLLNASGLFPYGLDGWRTYKGQPIEPIIVGCSYFDDITYYAAEALRSLGMPSLRMASHYGDYNTYVEWDMTFFAYGFDSDDVDWLAYRFCSEYADVPHQNPSSFSNETYDRCSQQLLHGTTYEEVYNASYWMQRILHEQVPLLVVYEDTYTQKYRTDKFTGHVQDLSGYIPNLWTMRRIHLLDGTDGGVVPIAIREAPDSFNIYTAESPASEFIFDELYSSLYRYGPDLRPYPDLASSLLIESHADNPAVPLGHTRFTVDIIQNATWSDGVPLTAEDIAFTIAYAFESGAYGNPAATELGDLIGAYAPNPYRVIFEYATESYWHFSKFAYLRTIPKHIFASDRGIGYDGWSEWNPVFDPEAPHVTCGPFLLAGYEPNQWYNLTWNPLFHYRVNASLHEPRPPANTTTGTITTTGVNGWSSMTLNITSAISTGSTVVILLSVYGIFRHRRSVSPPAE